MHARSAVWPMDRVDDLFTVHIDVWMIGKEIEMAISSEERVSLIGPFFSLFYSLMLKWDFWISIIYLVNIEQNADYATAFPWE